MGNNLFQFGRGKLIHLDQGALYRELKELVLSVSRGWVFRLQRHGGGRDSTRSLRITPRDCAMATSRGHCSTDNIRASVILKLRSRHASVRPFASVSSPPAKHDNSFLLAIVYRSWLPKFLSTLPRFRFHRSTCVPCAWSKRILLLSRSRVQLRNSSNLLLLIDCRI